MSSQVVRVRTSCGCVVVMSPVVDSDVEEEIDSQLLIIPVSPFSDYDIANEVVCPPTPTAFTNTGSFPSCSLPRPLWDVQSDDSGADPPSANFLANLQQLDKFADDGELTSLDWLQDINLLRNISPDQHRFFDPSLQKENTFMLPYDSEFNPGGKPPYSFSVLIFMAIESSPKQRLPVKKIYEWIADQFPFYKQAPKGWRNSVRHNLSLNRCFRKVDKVEYSRLLWKFCIFNFVRFVFL